MRVCMNQKERFIHGLAPLGNLFLILSLQELRREGMTYLSLYALERAVQATRELSSTYFSEASLRVESDLSDSEVSRACRTLKGAGLIRLARAEGDGRTRILIPTELGKRVLNRILAGAGQRLWTSIEEVGRFRRFHDATAHLRSAHKRLRGPLQISFFEKELTRKGKNRKRNGIGA
jgi:DNA-binding MarR family transcriptional regulator